MTDSSSFEHMLCSWASKDTRDEVLKIVIDDPSRMDELMECFFHKDLRISHNAAWPIGYITQRKPGSLNPYLKKMINNLDEPHHDAVVRNTFRTFQFVQFPEDLEGLVFEKAFNYLLDVEYAIAIRVFAMTVCANIAMKYPDLCHELIPVIEDHLPHGSTGFKSRGNKLLIELRKLLDES